MSNHKLKGTKKLSCNDVSKGRAMAICAQIESHGVSARGYNDFLIQKFGQVAAYSYFAMSTGTLRGVKVTVREAGRKPTNFEVISVNDATMENPFALPAPPLGQTPAKGAREKGKAKKEQATEQKDLFKNPIPSSSE